MLILPIHPDEAVSEGSIIRESTCGVKGRQLFWLEFLIQVRLSTRKFVSPRHQSDSKERCIIFAYLFCIIFNFSDTSYSCKSKELVTVPFALHSKLSANQESNNIRQENSFSMPTSAQQDSQEHFFGQTLSCSVLWAQVISVQTPLPHLRLCPHLTSREVLVVSSFGGFSSGLLRLHQWDAN